MFIRSWCISPKKLRCCSKFLISLTQGSRTKLRATVPNTNYFKPIILKFKKFNYNSNTKIICNFCMYGGRTSTVGGCNLEVCTGPADERWFFQRAGPAHEGGFFQLAGPGRASTWEAIFLKGRAGKKRNEFFNGRIWLQKKEDE